jgi:hypothetical protein
VVLNQSSVSTIDHRHLVHLIYTQRTVKFDSMDNDIKRVARQVVGAPKDHDLAGAGLQIRK